MHAELCVVSRISSCPTMSTVGCAVRVIPFFLSRAFVRARTLFHLESRNGLQDVAYPTQCPNVPHRRGLF